MPVDDGDNVLKPSVPVAEPAASTISSCAHNERTACAAHRKQPDENDEEDAGAVLHGVSGRNRS